MITTPVLIVGGGPIGLTLALLLSRQGIRSLLVNDRKTTTTHPKLDVINCRSMEIFRQLGLSEKIRAAGNPREANQYSALAVSAAGPFCGVMADRNFIYKPVAQAERELQSCRDGSLPLETMQRIAQMHLEPVLFEEAHADPNIEIRFGWSLFGFEQDETGVTALVQAVDGSDAATIRSQYLIGCDGPNSRVRNFLNIDYDGTRDLIGELYIIHFKSDDIAALYPDRQPYWHTWIFRSGFGGLLVSPDASRNDFVLHRPFGPRPGETLESIIEAAIGAKVTCEIVQSGPWRPQFLVATSFGRKRVFIAGDATHQYMPTGGLGMNTGLTEAHNLAWKLAASIKGWGGPHLLDSYEVERKPIAQRNRDHVKKCAAGAFEAQFYPNQDLAAATPAGDEARRGAFREFESKVSRMYESLGAEIGFRYRGSPIVVPDSAPEPAYDERRYVPTAWSGSRLPSTFFSSGEAVFDALRGDGFTLLAFDPSAEDIARIEGAASEVNVPLSIRSFADREIADLYASRFILVRPDQHVGWRGDSLPQECRMLLDTVRGATA